MINLFYKKKRFLEFILIFLIFLGISFKFNGNNVSWYWIDYPFIAIVFAIIAIFLVMLRIKIERTKET